MFSVKKTDLKSYIDCYNRALEQDGDRWCDEYAEEYANCLFYKMQYGKDGIGCVAIEEGPSYDTVCAVIEPGIKKHLSKIKGCGNRFLDLLSDRPLVAYCSVAEKKYSRFVKLLGFTRGDKSLDFVDDLGIMYEGYIRG